MRSQTVRLNASELIRKQWIVEILIRLVGATLAVLSIYPFLLWVINGILGQDFFSIWYLGYIILGVFCFSLAVVLWKLSRRLSVIIVQVIDTSKCPACGYELGESNFSVCPECSLLLSAEYRDSQPERDSGSRLQRDREIVSIAFRTLGITILLIQSYLLFRILFNTVAMFFMDTSSYSFRGSDAAIVELKTLFWLLIACVMIFANRKIARICAPEQEVKDGQATSQ